MLRLSYGEGISSARCVRQQRVANLVADMPERPDARMARDGNGGRPRQHQRRRGGTGRLRMDLEVVEQRVAALVAIHAAQIQHEAVGAGQARAAARRRRRGRAGSRPMPMIVAGSRGRAARADTSACSSGSGRCSPRGRAEVVAQHVEILGAVVFGRGQQRRRGRPRGARRSRTARSGRSRNSTRS